jgi:DNA-binding NarL/FixJ family response regulator
MRILLVDDNELVRKAIRGLLQKEANWEICGEASNGSQACEKLRELQPDVVLLDNRMPGVTGFETARLIRRENAQVKILILSQEDAIQTLPTALESGADGCVDKSRISLDLIPTVKKFQSAAV